MEDNLLIDRDFFLSVEEKQFKSRIESILIKIDSKFEELSLNNTIADEKIIFDHFKEIERLVDIKREEFKESIDNFCLILIDRIKESLRKYRVSYREDFNQFIKSHSLYKSQSSKILETIFCDPYIPEGYLQTIQQKYDNVFFEIHNKLCEFDDLHKKLTLTNSFHSNITSIETLFDRLVLTDHSSLDPFYESQILTTIALKYELKKLCEFSLDQQWKLLFRSSRDGFDSLKFHANDDHTNTIAIIKVKDAPCIFGGFANVTWCSNTYKLDHQSFIFSLINQSNISVKLKPKPSHVRFAVSTFSHNGPSFGLDDINTFFRSNGECYCTTDLGRTFSHKVTYVKIR